MKYQIVIKPPPLRCKTNTRKSKFLMTHSTITKQSLLWDGDAFHEIGMDFQVSKICNSANSHTHRGENERQQKKEPKFRLHLSRIRLTKTPRC